MMKSSLMNSPGVEDGLGWDMARASAGQLVGINEESSVWVTWVQG